MTVTEVQVAAEVNVPLLLKEPLRALLPMLVKVRGWEQVRPFLQYRNLRAAQSAAVHAIFGA